MRSHHGYVVAPGSTIDGREYRWLDPDAPVLTPPAWFIDECGQAARESKKRDRTPLVELDQSVAIAAAIKYLVNEAPGAIERQGGDNTTIKVANKVIDFGLSIDGAFRVMSDHWNETKAIPSWDPDPLRTKIQNAWNSRENPPGICFPEPAEDQFDAIQGAGRNAPADAWGDPVDLWAEQAEPPALPPGVVPDLVWQFANDRALKLGVEAGAPAAALITTLGSLVPAGSVVQVRQHDPHWKVKPVLWTMLIGAPGSNKSATLAQAMMPVQKIEREWSREQQRPAAEAEFERANVAGGDRAKSTDSLFEKAPVSRRRRRKIANDSTTEALAALLAENQDGILYFAEELAGLFGGMDAYRPRAGKDRPFWLQAKDGGSYTVDRRTQQSIYVPNCAVSVLGSIQTDKIRSLAPSLTDDGLMQRFIPVFMQRVGDGEDRDPDTALDERLLDTARNISATRPGRFRFAPDADAELRAVCEFRDAKIDEAFAEPALCQWLDKLPNEFARVAAVFHHIEWWSSDEAYLIGDPPPEFISADTARRARRFLTEFVYGHACALYKQTHSGAVVGDRARWIADFILARKFETIDERTICRAYLKTPDKRRDLPGVMRHLELLDWVRATTFHLNGQGKSWAVNPSVHDGQFAARADSERRRREAVRQQIGAAAAARSA